ASSANAEVDGTNVFYTQVYSNGTIGTWNHTTPLPEAVFDSAGVADSGFVYVIAGVHYNSNLDADLVTNVVYYAKLTSNGALSSWQTAVPLPKSVCWHSVGLWGHTIYSVGGCDVNGGADSNVYSARIQFDGTLSGWVTQPSLPFSRCAQSQAVNGAL